MCVGGGVLWGGVPPSMVYQGTFATQGPVVQKPVNRILG